MADRFRAPKGTRDILPGEASRWQALERTIRRVAAAHGFREIRTPIFEATRLFARGVGQETDIVSKEMYSWVDQGGDELTLRPELTAPVVRAFIQHNLAAVSPVTKVYYVGPLFRRERPQKGRYRQFHQMGVEAFGSPYPELDVDIIACAWNLFQELGLTRLELKLNSIGSSDSRQAYRQALKDFLAPHLAELTATSRRRFDTNPLRILDTKVPEEKALLQQAPNILDFLNPDDREHFDRVCALLNRLEIPFVLDAALVRGLDYYTRTTFEITSPALGSQDALCGGGRYDHLVEILGGKPTPGIGFAAGLERILLALEAEGQTGETLSPDVYVASLGDAARDLALKVADDLRRLGLRVELDYLRRSLKAQLREANKLGVSRVLVLGEDEIRRNACTVKELATGTQEEIPLAELVDRITA